MEQARISEVDDWYLSPASKLRVLADALDLSNLAVNYFELAPEEALSYTLHAHTDQEEVFYVRSGVVTFETETGSTAVEADEVIRFAPGEYKKGVNRGDSRAVVLAIGAPADPGETIRLRNCPTCGERTEHRLEEVGDNEAMRAVCLECGVETGRWSNEA